MQFSNEDLNTVEGKLLGNETFLQACIGNPFDLKTMHHYCPLNRANRWLS